jgi:GLPGLI family protein
LNKGLSYGGMAYNLSERNKRFVSQPIKKMDWHLTDTTKLILGYECKEAYRYNIIKIPVGTVLRTIVDTITVWYTPQINLPFGPYGYTRLPGLVLEAYDQSLFGRHLLAKEIIKEPVSIYIDPFVIIKLEEAKTYRAQIGK